MERDADSSCTGPSWEMVVDISPLVGVEVLENAGKDVRIREGTVGSHCGEGAGERTKGVSDS